MLIASTVACCALFHFAPQARAEVAAVVAAEQTRAIGTFECGGRRGSGGTDAAGNLYIPCSTVNGVASPHIKVYTPSGVLARTIALPEAAVDVAPSPNGATLYAVRSKGRTVFRMVRGANGLWAHDAAWKLAQFERWGTMYDALGEFIATDAGGNLYVSSGTWTSAPNAIVKYAPNGAVVTSFGDWKEAWDLGTFYWMNAGVAVSPDGARVFVTEVGNNRVQVFEQQPDGTYLATRAIGTDPVLDEDARTGWCGEEARSERLAAPYDVALAADDTLYVLSTSCLQLKAFNPTTGEWLNTWQFTSAAGGFIHGLALARDGTAYLAETGHVLRPVGWTAPAQKRPITDAYIGWATATSIAPDTTIAAWKWTPAGWQAASFADGTRLYMYPFAAGWKWAWNAGVWHAVRTSAVTVP